MRRHRILILGGTTEARQLASKLGSRPDCDVLLSLAGRTAVPMAQPVPTRSGGFGGANGLAAFLQKERYDLLIDATHPFATRISTHAALAAASTGTPLIVLRRPVWERGDGDNWISVPSMDDAVTALGTVPRNVFLAIGRQEAFHFQTAPWHRYLVRSVDPVDPPLDLPDVRYILATGPFDEADEIRLLQDNGIDVIVAKNSGGAATYGKIAAARTLGLRVIMVERRKPADVRTVETVDEAVGLVDHMLSPDRNLGV